MQRAVLAAAVAAALVLAAAAPSPSPAQTGTVPRVANPIPFPLLTCNPSPQCTADGAQQEAGAIADPDGIVRNTLPCGDVAARETCGGPGPGSGYSYDSWWNCGQQAFAADCWAEGTLDRNRAAEHTYGWGQADNDDPDQNEVYVCIDAHLRDSTTSQLPGCDYNYAQNCLYDSCNDQDNYAVLEMRALHLMDGQRRTVKGHGMA